MDMGKYNLLLTLSEERLTKRSYRAPIPPELRLAVTLMYLAHGCSFQILAWSFKLGVTTVRKIVYDTCEAIWEELHPLYLAPPTITDWEHTLRKFFLETGMPHCLGAIDGKLLCDQNMCRPVMAS